jgi:hypothetical protein
LSIILDKNAFAQQGSGFSLPLPQKKGNKDAHKQQQSAIGPFFIKCVSSDDISKLKFSFVNKRIRAIVANYTKNRLHEPSKKPNRKAGWRFICKY